MNRAWFAVALVWCSSIVYAQTQLPPAAGVCKITFSIVWHDLGARTYVSGGPEDAKWLPKDAAKKYPGICYDPAAPELRFVIRFNGHYTEQGVRNETSSVTGTVTDPDYNRSTVTGTITTPVPYNSSREYSTLSLEAKVSGKPGWTSITSFGRESHCTMGYGVCVSDRDTVRPLFVDALKWLRKAPRCSKWHDPSACPSALAD